MMSDKHCFGAYVHTKPNLSIFYVGKGKITRSRRMKRNDYHDKVVGKYGVENIGVGFIPCSSEEIAFELEKGLIKCLRRNGATLTNMTDGGDGPSGFVFSAESKAKMSAKRKGVKRGPRSEEFCAKMSAIKMGIKHQPHTAEHRAKLSAIMKGKKHTAEARVNMSLAQKQVASSELRANAKLTLDNVLDIKRRLKSGESQKEISCFYGVRQSLISRIKTKSRWSHVGE